MTGLPITVTFTFDDMAKAERAIAAVREVLSPAASDADEANQGGDHAKSDHRSHESALNERRRQEAIDDGDRSQSRTFRSGRHNVGSSAPRNENDTETPAESVISATRDGDAIAAVKGQARPASVVDAEPSPSSTILPISKPLRPHCQNREVCAGVGLKHCYRCSKAAEAAQVSEVAA